MDYKKIYDELIINARIRVKPDCYYESHHIIPRCLSGDNADHNIVKLTFDEHYIAHLLLYKIYGTDYPDMIFSIDCFYRWDRKVHKNIRDMPRWIRRKLTIRREELKREHKKRLN